MTNSEADFLLLQAENALLKLENSRLKDRNEDVEYYEHLSGKLTGIYEVEGMLLSLKKRAERRNPEHGDAYEAMLLVVRQILRETEEEIEDFYPRVKDNYSTLEE